MSNLEIIVPNVESVQVDRSLESGVISAISTAISAPWLSTESTREFRVDKKYAPLMFNVVNMFREKGWNMVARINSDSIGIEVGRPKYKFEMSKSQTA